MHSQIVKSSCVKHFDTLLCLTAHTHKHTQTNKCCYFDLHKSLDLDRASCPVWERSLSSCLPPRVLHQLSRTFKSCWHSVLLSPLSLCNKWPVTCWTHLDWSYECAAPISVQWGVDGCPKMDSREYYPLASLSGLLNGYWTQTPLEPAESQMFYCQVLPWIHTKHLTYTLVQHAVLGRSSL